MRAKLGESGNKNRCVDLGLILEDLFTNCVDIGCINQESLKKNNLIATQLIIKIIKVDI